MAIFTATERVNKYLDDQSCCNTLRFITCGSVGDGKSTLIGRMLYEAQMIFDDQVASLQTDPKKMGTQGGEIDFSLLVDGLAAEREQGITIDVAYRFFSSDRRKFIVADTPGHEQYTRNMFTGASTADTAIILIDARQGTLTQTRRHSIICSTLGIKNVVVAVNKMDLIDYDHATFEKIIDDYKKFAERLAFECITPIPISALLGDNIVGRSKNTQWYQGPTLLGHLEIFENNTRLKTGSLRMPVQWVNRPNLDFWGFSGKIVCGRAQSGDIVKILPSGKTATIKKLFLYEDRLDWAEAGQSVTITLDQVVDASRGDLIVAADDPCEVADQFEVTLVWLDQEPGYVSRSYWLKIGPIMVGAQITNLKYQIDVGTQGSHHSLENPK